ncbi:MAG TPA: PLP-dependent aminotransferase family protein [Kofleriaceae bacterium]|nr:PLP-dependent aminotransferase family protein [Kofleriaceae bacterium]
MTRRAAADLLIQIDERAGSGLQEQIYHCIRRAIVHGVLRAGARMTSSRALAAELGVSRTTTQLVFEQLHAEGYLVARRGSGTFVAAELPDRRLRVPAPRAPSDLMQPILSRRGEALAGGAPSARRIPGPPRPFRIGVPALELFPVRLWARLASRRVLSITSSQLDYGAPGGLQALREAIAEHIGTARGTQCDADQIYIVGSAQRGLDLVSRLLLDPGDRVLMEEPGYPGAWSALIGAGASIVPVPVDQDGMQIDAVDGRARGARMAYVTPSHQFPLGVPMSLARRLALLRWASAAGAWVVEDDYDSEFRHGAQPIPCLHGLDADGRVIYVGSFSKSVFPSLRLGFLIAPPALRDRLLAARRTAVDPLPPFLEQAVLADFMAGGHFARHLSRMRAAYRERLEALGDAAERYCGGALTLRPVRTGLHAVADLRDADAQRVFEEARARGVETMPLSAYMRGGGLAPSGLVLGFGAVSTDALARGMRGLAAAIEAARGRRGRAMLSGDARRGESPSSASG